MPDRSIQGGDGLIITQRLRPEVFRLPVEKIRAGYKTDVYFNRTKEILQADGHHAEVTMQVFQKERGVIVVGTDQSLAILHVGTGYYKDLAKAQQLFEDYLTLERQAYALWLRIGSIGWDEYAATGRKLFDVSRRLNDLWVDCFLDLDVYSLYDGETADPYESVMHIEGDYYTFSHLETLYLGALTDGTQVATNTREVVDAARGKSIMMFGARHQSHEAQAGSGYAAYVGGAQGVSTDEQAEWWGSRGLGTIPHALIAAYGGDTVLATLKFDQYIDHEVAVTSLVDFDNDCAGTSLAVARALGGRLWGVRLDTAANMIDYSVWKQIMEEGEDAGCETTGVNARLVWNVRRALDAAGFGEVRIVASGGFTAGKIRQFEADGVPVDAYGVGSSLFEGKGGKYDYTADIVRVNDANLAKKGRAYNPNPRLHKVDLKQLIS
ncbi:MAG: quinolinate phosphoribosyl transferase [Chloroflexi bacterium]|nr:quinolinate phosphoribosyl transferase [Chloroflexota bacterium]